MAGGIWTVHLPSGNICMGIISDPSQSSLFPAGCIMMSEGTVESNCVGRGKVGWTLIHLHAGLMGLKTF